MLTAVLHQGHLAWYVFALAAVEITVKELEHMGDSMGSGP